MVNIKKEPSTTLGELLDRFTYIILIISLFLLAVMASAYVLYFNGTINIMTAAALVYICSIIIIIILSLINILFIQYRKLFIRTATKVLFITAMFSYSFSGVQTAYILLLISFLVYIVISAYYIITHKVFAQKAVSRLKTIQTTPMSASRAVKDIDSQIKWYKIFLIINIILLVLGTVFISRAEAILPVYVKVMFILHSIYNLFYIILGIYTAFISGIFGKK